MTKGQLAMAAAIIYPEPEKGGRNKKSGTAKLAGSGGFTHQRGSQARVVLKHTLDTLPWFSSGVMACSETE